MIAVLILDAILIIAALIAQKSGVNPTLLLGIGVLVFLIQGFLAFKFDEEESRKDIVLYYIVYPTSILWFATKLVHRFF